MVHHPSPAPSLEIPEDDIRDCAYYLWLEAGRPAGRDQEFWHTARERLRHSPLDQRPPGGPPARGPGKKCAQLAKMRGAARPASG